MFVTVLDVNDNRPIFLQSSYEASVPEDIPEGHSIVQVAGRGPLGWLVGWGQTGPHSGLSTWAPWHHGGAWKQERVQLLLREWPVLWGKGTQAPSCLLGRVGPHVI